MKNGYDSSSTSGRQVVVVAFILISAIFIFLNIMNNDFGLTYELTGEGIHVTHKGGFLVRSKDFTIRYKDISVVQTMDPFPKHKKVNGIDGKVRIGDFDIDGVGAVKLYAQTIQRPLVLIATADIVFGLTPQDTQSFVDRVEAGRRGVYSTEG